MRYDAFFVQIQGPNVYHCSDGKDVSLEFIADRGLIALQGPESVKVLQSLTPTDLTKLAFMTSTVDSVAGVENCRITRCGYVVNH